MDSICYYSTNNDLSISWWVLGFCRKKVYICPIYCFPSTFHVTAHYCMETSFLFLICNLAMEIMEGPLYTLIMQLKFPEKCNYVIFSGAPFCSIMLHYLNFFLKAGSSSMWRICKASQATMAVDMVVLLKLKLLAAAGGHPHCHLHVALLWFFLLKLPLATRMRGSYTDMIFSMRLFFFRLNRVLFPDTPGRNGRRWQRALRLFQERVAEDGRYSPNTQSNEDSLHAFSMLAL